MAGSLFFGLGFFYLTGAEREEVQNDEVSSVPYYSSVPETVGILLEIENFKTYFQLDFEDRELTVIYADFANLNDSEIYGYSVDYTVSADLELLGAIVDRLSGIDLEFEDEILNYTGVQVTELLNPENDELRRDITEKLIKKVSKLGLANDDFLYIIKNSETNLTVPACYFWAEHISSICSTVRYVN